MIATYVYSLYNIFTFLDLYCQFMAVCLAHLKWMKTSVTCPLVNKNNQLRRQLVNPWMTAGSNYKTPASLLYKVWEGSGYSRAVKVPWTYPSLTLPSSYCYGLSKRWNIPSFNITSLIYLNCVTYWWLCCWLPAKQIQTHNHRHVLRQKTWLTWGIKLSAWDHRGTLLKHQNRLGHGLLHLYLWSIRNA